MSEKIEIKRQLKYLENWLVEHRRYKIIGSLDSKFSFDLDDLQKFYDYITNLQNQLQQKENILKEVRKYIGSYNLEYLHEANEHNLADILEELLEIIDKENK